MQLSDVRLPTRERPVRVSELCAALAAVRETETDSYLFRWLMTLCGSVQARLAGLRHCDEIEGGLHVPSIPEASLSSTLMRIGVLPETVQGVIYRAMRIPQATMCVRVTDDGGELFSVGHSHGTPSNPTRFARRPRHETK